MTLNQSGPGDYQRALESMHHMMQLLDGIPDLMPAVPETTESDLIALGQIRILHEDHLCLRCGELASTALVSRHEQGYRGWLDLCASCARLLFILIEESKDKDPFH